MALVITTGSLVRQYNAFTGLSATERSQSGIARAEVVYYNVNDNWAAPGASNWRLYQTGQVSLPKDFGYVLTDAFVRVSSSGDESINTERVGDLRIFPGGILGPQINCQLTATPSAQDASATTAIGSIQASKFNTNYPSYSGQGSIVYTLKDKPTTLIYPFGSQNYTSTPNPASIWEWQVGEQKVNDAADYDVSAYFRLLQYDIDQSYNYVVQSPQLTR